MEPLPVLRYGFFPFLGHDEHLLRSRLRLITIIYRLYEERRYTFKRIADLFEKLLLFIFKPRRYYSILQKTLSFANSERSSLFPVDEGAEYLCMLTNRRRLLPMTAWKNRCWYM